MKDSFTVHVKTDDIYKNIAEDVAAIQVWQFKFRNRQTIPKGKIKK